MKKNHFGLLNVIVAPVVLLECSLKSIIRIYFKIILIVNNFISYVTQSLVYYVFNKPRNSCDEYDHYMYLKLTNEIYIKITSQVVM